MTDPAVPPDAAYDPIGRLAELIGGEAMAELDADMGAVLDMLGRLGARPLEQLTPAAARQQPRLRDAVAALVAQAGATTDEDGVATEELMLEGTGEAMAGRLYRPAVLADRLNPMVLYFHGGGFVTGDLDSHDASARALARQTGAIVLSVDYRLAPEHAFPAAHDDAWAAWTWLGNQAHRLSGDPRRMAVVGEDAGANLAAHVALLARMGRSHHPVRQVLIHPVAGTALNTDSYTENRRARPIGLAAMRWRLQQLFPAGVPDSEPHLQLAARTDLAGVAPATIVLARIDPLRSEGEDLAAALQQAGVPVSCMIYEGVTQGFFGLGRLVNKALFAQGDVADALARAFAATAR